MPGIMMNSYSSSSRKTLKRSCFIRSRATSSNNSGVAAFAMATITTSTMNSSYSSSSSFYNINSSSSTRSAAASRTNSIGVRSNTSSATNSGSSTPRCLTDSSRSLDTYFAKPNDEQQKTDEWGHFVYV